VFRTSWPFPQVVADLADAGRPVPVRPVGSYAAAAAILSERDPVLRRLVAGAGFAEEWGRLNVHDRLPVIDGLLAASAKIRGWTLVTRNVGDLARSGLLLRDPFDPPSAT
jgi:predicted nucleic acid-binding protein